MISPLRVANEQITAAFRVHNERQRERQVKTHRIREVDILIAECEERQLGGERWASEAMEARFRALAGESASPDVELHAGVSIVRLMDALFTLQEELFDRCVDRSAYPDDFAQPLRAAPTTGAAGRPLRSPRLPG